MICERTQSKFIAVSATPLGVRGTDILPRLEKAGRTQAALGRHLQMSVHAVGRLVRNDRELPPSVAAKVDEFLDGPVESLPQTVRIPVFGFTATDDPARIDLTQPLDDVEIPANLVRGRSLAVRVPGARMEPRLHAGEMVIVGLNVPAQRNGDCLVEMTDDTGQILEYRGQGSGYVFCWQYSPGAEVKIQATKVRAIHAVLWRR